jgi:ectoine hydroxylase-related dioxygenase (phytanoyl-CoA dioxygenase family)
MLSEQDINDHAARIEREGFTVIDNAIEPDLVDLLKADIERLERERAIGAGENLFEGFKTKRVYNLLARGKAFERAAEHDHVLPVVERVLDRGFLVSTVSSVVIEPGEDAQPIHADDQLIPLPKPHQPLTCTVMWALTDFTEETGGTRLIPGSHKRDGNPDMMATHDDVQSTVMKRGSVLIYNGSLWHGGGANRSNERRFGLAVGYCVGWMRQQENQQLGIPREVARGFSPRLRKLAGYGVYKLLYGHIDKCSPVDLLDETGPRVIVGVVK